MATPTHGSNIWRNKKSQATTVTQVSQTYAHVTRLKSDTSINSTTFWINIKMEESFKAFDDPFEMK